VAQAVAQQHLDNLETNHIEVLEAAGKADMQLL
jgi:hypothetical protein